MGFPEIDGFCEYSTRMVMFDCSVQPARHMTLRFPKHRWRKATREIFIELGAPGLAKSERGSSNGAGLSAATYICY